MSEILFIKGNRFDLAHKLSTNFNTNFKEIAEKNERISFQHKQSLKLTKKKTYYSTQGVLTLSEEKIIHQENVIGSNIRHLRIEKSIGQTELIKYLQLKNIDIIRKILVKNRRKSST